jgi:hypothetical protein
VESPAVAKAKTPKSAKRQSLVGETVAAGSPVVSSIEVVKATPKSSKKRSSSVHELTTPNSAVRSPALGKRTPKSARKQSLLPGTVEVENSVAVDEVVRTSSKSNKKRSLSALSFGSEGSLLVDEKKSRLSAVDVSSRAVIVDLDKQTKSAKRSGEKSTKRFRRSVVDVESVPRVISAGLVTPGRAVALRAIFGKSATSNLKTLIANESSSSKVIIKPKSSRKLGSPLALAGRQSTKTPAKSAKKSVPKKKLWSEIVAQAKVKSSKKGHAHVVKPVIRKAKKAISLQSSLVCDFCQFKSFCLYEHFFSLLLLFYFIHSLKF